MVQRRQHRVQLEAIAALQPPLQLTNPDGDAGQLGSVLIDFQAQHVVRAGDVDLALQAQRLGLQVGLVLNIFQAFERQVQEVATAASRVEHPKVLQPLQEAGKQRLRIAISLVAVLFAARQRRPQARQQGRPLGQQRARNHGGDHPVDGGRVGVVGAQLAAHRRIEPALKQRAKNAGVDGRPVQRTGGFERGHVGQRQRRHGHRLEQPAVEPGDVVHAKQAAAAHRGQQRIKLHAQAVRADVDAHQPLKQPLGQQAHVLGKKAEHALRQKMAHLAGRRTGGAQPLGGGGKGAGGVLGDLAVAAPGFEVVWVGPQRAQGVLGVGAGQVVQRDDMALTRRAGEMAVDLDAQPVAHHQQRRVVQRQRVHHQLLERTVQAFAGGLVFPGKVIFQPDIGKAVGSGFAARRA